MIEEPEETVDQLEHKGEELDKDIEKTKDDWERKQESADVPGAVSEEDSAGTPDAPDDEEDSAGTPNPPNPSKEGDG